ncbi:hypothetical protein FA95DRAFT_128641 [Auriscalpium vulgare]|uniref:Uncharacterized protein n=1 Tax=Auriscalpium vulgare TaxID=40419 RepID=A0ACB8RNY9_9AGAM|nr:hypothetical protein FA95DRAFT_128641 [Auriscalpium vulgare]
MRGRNTKFYCSRAALPLPNPCQTDILPLWIPKAHYKPKSGQLPMFDMQLTIKPPSREHEDETTDQNGDLRGAVPFYRRLGRCSKTRRSKGPGEPAKGAHRKISTAGGIQCCAKIRRGQETGLCAVCGTVHTMLRVANLRMHIMQSGPVLQSLGGRAGTADS